MSNLRNFFIRPRVLISLIIGLVGFSFWARLPAHAQSPLTSAQPEIVGGQDADPGEYPWQVALTDLQYQPFCGGSLLTPRWVITAGHCVQGIKSSNQHRVRVVLGAYQFNNSAEPERQVFLIKRIIQHPDFVAVTFDHDLALIELEHPAQLTPHVRMIAAVQDGQDAMLWQPGKVATVTGWGLTSESGGNPLVLQEVNLPIIEQATCAAIFGTNLTANMLCAGDIEGGKDACRGDSGGPLIVPDGSPSGGGGFKLAGLVSWGNGCARPDRFGVYTRIANYSEWIDSYIHSDLISSPHLIDSVHNAGFENGPDQSWSESSPFALELIVNYGPVLASSGRHLVWLGGNLDHVDRIWQTITFPVDTPIFLNFQYQIQSSDADCSHDSSALIIGQWRYKTFELCQQQATNQWQSATVRLDSLQNHKAVVKFVLWNDATNPSSFFVDNVQLSIGGPLDSAAKLIEVAESFDSVEGTIVQAQPRFIFLPLISN